MPLTLQSRKLACGNATPATGVTRSLLPIAHWPQSGSPSGSWCGGEVDHRRATDGQHHVQNQPTQVNDDKRWKPCEV